MSILKSSEFLEIGSMAQHKLYSAADNNNDIVGP